MIAALLVLVGCVRYDCTGDACPEDGPPSDGVAVVVNDYIQLRHGHPKNVVIVSIDTLRRDHLNLFGYGTETLPRHGVDVTGNTATLDTILTEGVGFLDHRSCSSWTLPSFVCFLTGMDQLTAGYWPYESDLDGDGVSELPQAPDELELLPELFHARGYYTMLMSGSGFLGASPNMQQGYDEGWGRFADSFGDGEEYKADHLINNVLEMLDDHAFGDQPFYLHVHLMEPHAPWIPPERYMEEADQVPLPAELTRTSGTTFAPDFDTEEGTVEVWRYFEEQTPQVQEQLLAYMEYRYDMEIRFADDQLRRLINYLEEHDLFEDTVLVYMTDHGEEFFEHGNFNHGYNSFDEQIRVAAAFYQPGNLLPAAVEEMTLHQDLAPTLFAILGWEPEPQWSGQVPGSAEPRAYVSNLVYRAEKTHQAVTDGKQKLMFRWDGSDHLEGPRYFYDLLDDPHEQCNRHPGADAGCEDADAAVVQPWWDLLLPEIEELDAREKHAAPAVEPGL